MSFFILDSPGGYELESKTLFNAMTIAPNTSEKRIINKLILNLKVSGDWDKIDVLWICAAFNQQAARLNWKNPITFTLTEVNSPKWTVLQGYTGNGTTDYINTNFNLATNGVNYILNSGSGGYYGRLSFEAADTTEFGVKTGLDGIAIVARYTADTFIGRVNSGTNNSGANTSTQGLFSVVRTASNNQETYRNAVLLVKTATLSTLVVSQPLYFIGFNNNGVTLFSNKQISMVYVGSGSINQLSLYNTIQAYMTAVGANV